MFCSGCGASVPDDADFCGKCGKDIRNEKQWMKGQEEALPFPRKRLLQVSGAVPILFFWIGGLVPVVLALTNLWLIKKAEECCGERDAAMFERWRGIDRIALAAEYVVFFTELTVSMNIMG